MCVCMEQLQERVGPCEGASSGAGFSLCASHIQNNSHTLVKGY